mgnify:CR=1 FL=1
MLLPLPMAGAGFFGLSLGMMAPIMTLVLHLVYGAVLGAAGGTIGFYGKTPVVQGAAVTTLATTPTATDIATAVNSIISRLQTVGIIK